MKTTTTKTRFRLDIFDCRDENLFLSLNFDSVKGINKFIEQQGVNRNFIAIKDAEKQTYYCYPKLPFVIEDN